MSINWVWFDVGVKMISLKDIPRPETLRRSVEIEKDMYRARLLASDWEEESLENKMAAEARNLAFSILENAVLEIYQAAKDRKMACLAPQHGYLGVVVESSGEMGSRISEEQCRINSMALDIVKAELAQRHYSVTTETGRRERTGETIQFLEIRFDSK